MVLVLVMPNTENTSYLFHLRRKLSSHALRFAQVYYALVRVLSSERLFGRTLHIASWS